MKHSAQLVTLSAQRLVYGSMPLELAEIRPRSNFPESRNAFSITCDQSCFLFRGGKARLIQSLDYSSVASSEFGLFCDWSRNQAKGN